MKRNKRQLDNIISAADVVNYDRERQKGGEKLAQQDIYILKL